MSKNPNEYAEPFDLASLFRLLSELSEGKSAWTDYKFKEWCNFNWRKNLDVDFQDNRMPAALKIAADVDCQWDLYIANAFPNTALDSREESKVKLPRQYYQQWLQEAEVAKKNGPGLFEGDDDNTVLYCTTGPKELELVRSSGFNSWPPRLPEQPIFYPVTNEAYAIQIAKEWNVKESRVGFVTRFKVKKSFMDQFKVEKVGGKNHLEWWIPSERLEELNANIVGKIEVIGEYK